MPIRASRSFSWGECTTLFWLMWTPERGSSTFCVRRKCPRAQRGPKAVCLFEEASVHSIIGSAILLNFDHGGVEKQDRSPTFSLLSKQMHTRSFGDLSCFSNRKSTRL